MTLLLASAPLRLPSAVTPCRITPQRGTSCGHRKSQSLPYCWDVVAAFSHTAATGIWHGEGEGQAAEAQGKATGQEWGVSGQARGYPRNSKGQGRAGAAEMLQASPRSLRYVVKCRDQVRSTGPGKRPSPLQGISFEDVGLAAAESCLQPAGLFLPPSLALSMPLFPRLERRIKK